MISNTCFEPFIVQLEPERGALVLQSLKNMIGDGDVKSWTNWVSISI